MMTRILLKSALETIQADGPRVFLEQTARYLTLYGSPVRIGNYWWQRLTGRTEQVVQVQGSWMVLDLTQRGIHSDLYINRIREPQATRYLQSILRPDWVVVEAGANIGYYALQEARVVRTVIALEPSRDSFEFLQRNIDLNKYKNIMPVRMAASNHGGPIRFKLSKACNWNRVAVPYENWDCLVPSTTLDRLVGNSRVDFVRMDVEGYEAYILDGMKSILTNQRPRMFIEVHRDLLRNYGSSQMDLMALLAKYDYAVEKSFISAREGPTGQLRSLLDDPDTRKVITQRGIASHYFFAPVEAMVGETGTEETKGYAL